MKNASGPLALRGGQPVFQGMWPKWPQATGRTIEYLMEAAQSDRWTISGAYNGRELFEKRLSRTFATFVGANHAVATANGTSAITIALEAAGVRNGDEVLVPGLTWVACASATAALGAVPILVDVNPVTLAMDLAAAEAAITPRTTAILLVHPYCMVADPEAFRALADRRRLILVEDCSQAHGARWNGRMLGTFGSAGAFSLQQTKLLTCGEGGLAVTSDPDLYDRMQQLRADGRRYLAEAELGSLELEEVGSIQGRNYCLSEFQAAVALAQLEALEEQNRLRERNSKTIADALRDVPGASVPSTPPQVTHRSFYQFLVHLDPEVIGTYDPDQVVAAMRAETGVFCELIDTPLNANRLYNPLLSPRMPADSIIRAAFDPARFPLPNAERARATHIAFGHWALMGGADHCDAIVGAFRKVIAHIADLRQ